jgi:hypothetical protein
VRVIIAQDHVQFSLSRPGLKGLLDHLRSLVLRVSDSAIRVRIGPARAATEAKEIYSKQAKPDVVRAPL